MDNTRKIRLIDLKDDVKEIDAVIRLHTVDISAMMIDPYKFKYDNLLSY